MKKLSLFILSFSLLWISFSCQKSADKSKVIRLSKYREVIRESRQDIGMSMFQDDVPGMSVAVYIDNKMVWSEAFGYANKELKAPATPNTKFRIGGLSQLFTGAVLARSVSEGKLDLKKPLGDFYPELPKDKHSLTLYNLAHQSSGIRQVAYDEKSKMGYQTMRKGISMFIEDTLLFKPGEYAFESEFNYDLIGAAMERVYDKRFPKVLKEMLVDTMKLESTMCDDPVWIIENRSQCYDRNIIARTVRATLQDNRHRASSVGMLSSAYDIARLGNELLYPSFLTQEEVDMILDPTELSAQNGNLGMGITITQDNFGRKLYMANGSTKGGSAGLLIYPKYNMVIAVAKNLSDDNQNMSAFKIASKFIEFLDPPKEIKEDKKEEKK